MFHRTNTIRQATVVLTISVSLALLAASQALAGGGSSRYQDGWYSYAVALTKANQRPVVTDGRSPDTVDAALAARQRDFGPPDGWYGYAVALTKANQHPSVTDGRSPDTVDAAVQAHSPVVTIVRSPGFDWGDFGIGVAAAFGAMLFGLAIRVLTARQGRKHPSPVATA